MSCYLIPKNFRNSGGERMVVFNARRQYNCWDDVHLRVFFFFLSLLCAFFYVFFPFLYWLPSFFTSFFFLTVRCTPSISHFNILMEHKRRQINYKRTKREPKEGTERWHTRETNNITFPLWLRKVELITWHSPAIEWSSCRRIPKWGNYLWSVSDKGKEDK